MMIGEFEELAGIEVTAKEYEAIESEYMGCDNTTKQDFVKGWLKDGGVQRILRLRKKMIYELECDTAMKEREINRLTAELEKTNRENNDLSHRNRECVQIEKDFTDIQQRWAAMSERYENLVKWAKGEAEEHRAQWEKISALVR